ELARLHMSQIPVLLSEYIPDVSPDLEQIVAKVLAKEPAQRYRTANQLGRVLETFGSREPKRTSAPVAVPVSQPISQPISQPAPYIPEYAPEAEPAPVYQHQPVREVPPEFAFMDDLAPPAYTPAPEPTLDIDWASVGLGLLALLLVGGLIPFWMWVYFAYNPPIP
ncbi:MAG: hypothetical protein L3J16_00265, partial [Anaerolineales bacterium]|nr:hypothetical protein [Anaerolineales bacterium]